MDRDLHICLLLKNRSGKKRYTWKSKPDILRCSSFRIQAPGEEADT
jgi:hypothetical protein